ncbi:MAG: hypothetical protein SV186_02865 [Candidatus Nanohaloarchaea archaeon]|nr:hypothetical protein [Candidatus Nanohaloarchaea archaeon]
MVHTPGTNVQWLLLGFAFVLFAQSGMAAAPSVTDQSTAIAAAWNLSATHFRPGDELAVTADVTDGDGQSDIGSFYANVSSPDGTEASFMDLSIVGNISDGYRVRGKYRIPAGAPTGSWNVTVAAVDENGTLATNTTGFQVQTFAASTLAVRFPGAWTGFIDDQQAEPGTYTDLSFPYFAAVDDPLLAGLINYGPFQRLAYSATSDWHWANMTQAFTDNRYLLPFTRADVFELEQHQDSMTVSTFSGRTFLRQTVPVIGYEPPEKKHVRVVLDYSGSDINITGFQGSIGGGIHSLQIVNEGVENGVVQIRIGLERLG